MTTSASGKSEGMVILVVGSGGREHAIAWKLSQSKRVQKVLVAPGNGGTARGLSKVENVPGVKADDVEGLVRVAKSSGTSFVVVGPEIPLVKGLADALAPHGIKCFGPKAKAAELEGSKAFSKDLMAKYGIPTAEYRNFKDYDAALAYVRSAKHEVVIKASGLAAGKGVLLPESLEEAEHALKEIMQDRRFGEAGAEVVIEERLEGEECSLLAFTDGRVVRAMPAAQDHKRIFDGDKGPNTGGMGAYAPAPVLTPRLRRMAVETALQRAVDAMAKEGRTFAGVIYAGLMISPDGKDFKVLEYNCRFGDPETQVILPLLRTDLVDVMEACAEGRLDKLDVQWHDRSVAATVVAASEGYPGSYPKGRTISGLDKVPSDAATTRVFQAGTRLDSATGLVQTSGGRVLAVTGVASNLTEALGGAYRRLSSIRFDGMQFRRDIARRAIERPLRIGVLGSTRGTDMQVILDSVAAGKLNARVAVVVSNRKRAGILDKARAGGVLGAHFVSVKGKKDREAYDAEVTSILENYGVDLVLMIGYMRIVSGAFVRRWWNRCLNVHPSLLPDFGGGMDMDVHAEVIKAKKRVSGCTVHFVTEEVDGGAIVEQMQCSVASDETPETLKVKVQLLEGAALINAVQRFARGDLDAIMRAHPLPRSSDSNTAATKDDAFSKISYAQAGVDIEAGEELVSMIGPACKRTARSGCDADLGGFGGLFDLAAAGYDAADTLIVGATDGVGTKLLLAERSGEHGTIGQDLVAMCVNDLIVQGAEPLFFLDYYATGKLTNAVASKVVTGIADGCSLAGCALIGGETAEMPQMYDGSRYDLAGFAVGAVRKSQLLPRAVRAGDVCLGLAASGVHSNGFSLVRKIVDVLGGDDLYNKRPPFDSQHPTLVRALLEPTKIYVKSLLALLKNVEIRALAHITGGGLVQNIPRVLGSDVDVAIDLNSWPLLPVFKWFVGSKRVTQEEMLKTFNCGIGMVVIVPADKADAAKAILEKNGESVYTIGKACKGTGIVRTTGILA